MQPTPSPIAQPCHPLIEETRHAGTGGGATWNTGVFRVKCAEDGLKGQAWPMQTIRDLILLGPENASQGGWSAVCQRLRRDGAAAEADPLMMTPWEGTKGQGEPFQLRRR